MHLLKSAALLLLVCGSAAAEVQRIEIRSREDLGSFERLLGRVYFSTDPKLTVNQAIADIALAPRNPEGKVEFSSDLMLIRPKKGGKSRGSLFLEIANRGGPQSLGLLSGAAGGDPRPEHWDLGDRFVLEQGFTLAYLGWQFDLAAGRGVKLYAPVAPVEGPVRQSHVEPPGAGTHANTFSLAYCATDPEDKTARLTYRMKIDEPGKVIDRSLWHFRNDGCAVTIQGSFDTGLYEAIYRAKNPAVAGLGMAAIRDFVSYLKYGGKSSELREDPSQLRRIIGYGYSQSGRFLREFLRDGFNQDEMGRAAFDALMISSAGAGGGSFDHRFAMPGVAGNSVLDILRPSDIPPFTDDGVLAKAEAAHVTPRIFYTFSSSEYWTRFGSLTYTTPDGKADVPLNPRSRLYFLTGTPHAAGPLPPARRSRGAEDVHPLNFAEQRWVTRALLLDLDAWTASGTEPPPSAYPTIRRGELVPLTSIRFPTSPVIARPYYMPQIWRMDFGPEFAAKGIISQEPPALGAPYTVLLPQVDADGNDQGGIKLQEIAVPLGTYTGWNMQLPSMSSLNFLSGLVGSFEPFPRTREEREKSADSRRSIQERYSSRQDYLDRVKRASESLVRQRFMLADDIPGVMRRAAEMWGQIVKEN